MHKRDSQGAMLLERGAGRSPGIFLKRRAFTLTEVLIAILLGAAVSLVTLQATRQILFLTAHLSNRTLARERGQSALSIIEPRVLHAALGLRWPRAGSLFQNSFGGGENDSPTPGTWTDRGAFQILDGPLLSPVPETGGICRGEAIVVLYSMPSGLVAKLPCAAASLDIGLGGTVQLLPAERRRDFHDKWMPAKRDLRSWAVFPLSGVPVHMKVYDSASGRLTVRAAESLTDSLAPDMTPTLRAYDELHYLRAERFRAMNGTLWSAALESAWTPSQPRVDGVLATWYEWDPSKRLLTAWILTTGGKADSGGSARPSSWPAEAPWRGEFSLHDAAVSQNSWLLRNM